MNIGGMSRAVACVPFLLAACSKVGRGPTADPLLDHLPASATLVVGMHRGGSAEDVREGLAPLRAQAGAPIPVCAMDALAALEDAVLGVDLEARGFALVARGAGLKAILAPCLGRTGQELKWIDDHTAVASWGGKVAAGKLAENAAIVALLGEVDRAAGLYAVADERALSAAAVALPLGTPHLERAWAQLAGSPLELRTTIELGSDADARAFADLARARVTALPFHGVTVEANGRRVIGTLPFAALAPGMPQELPRASAYVATIGMLAAIAVPAFMKNARKAKSSEAVTSVKRLFDGARSYHEEHHTLPPSTAITPPLGACCQGAGEKCAPDPKWWSDPSWKALSFAMDDPHYYSYRYEAAGDSFTVTAFGDLNCDGVYSTFEMAGRVAPDGTVSGAAGLYKDKELE